MKEKRDIRLNKIIEAAINEFIEKGYEAASMESIARRAALSKGGLYHHYKSKAEVLYAVNLKFLEPVTKMISGIEAEDSLDEGLSGFISDYLRYWNDHRVELMLYFRTMNESFGNKMIMDLYRESAAGMFDYLESVFFRGREIDLFKEHNARMHSVALISCLDGFLGYLLIDPSLDVEHLSKELDQIFIKNLLKHKN